MPFRFYIPYPSVRLTEGQSYALLTAQKIGAVHAGSDNKHPMQEGVGLRVAPSTIASLVRRGLLEPDGRPTPAGAAFMVVWGIIECDGIFDGGPEGWVAIQRDDDYSTFYPGDDDAALEIARHTGCDVKYFWGEDIDEPRLWALTDLPTEAEFPEVVVPQWAADQFFRGIKPTAPTDQEPTRHVPS